VTGAACRAAIIFLAAASVSGCFDDSGPNRNGKDAAASGRNGAPTISGSPTTSASVGTQYVFVPAATDPDGDALVFTITGLPAWMTFSPSNGQLSGVPGTTAVGRYDNIRIHVTDGASVASLPPFSIVVPTVAATGSATLRWQPPANFTDGQPLTDLSGYRVLYGRARDAMDQVVHIGNPATTFVVIDRLTPGTWYFAVTATTALGLESQLSDVVYKTIF
jgi:hypothetical protein